MTNVPRTVRYAAPRSGAAGSDLLGGRSVEAMDLTAEFLTISVGTDGWGNPA